MHWKMKEDVTIVNSLADVVDAWFSWDGEQPTVGVVDGRRVYANNFTQDGYGNGGAALGNEWRWGGGIIARLTGEPGNYIALFEYTDGSAVVGATMAMDELESRGIPYCVMPNEVVVIRGVRVLGVLDRVTMPTQDANPLSLLRVSRAMAKGAQAPRREALMLSGPDFAEAHRNYFCCELPPSASGVTTVGAALEALKPAAVKVAEQAGRTIKRQGDIFAIPTPSVKYEMLYGHPGRVLDTNHEAEHFIQDGLTYARGYMRHRPVDRHPDHDTIDLGEQWHLLVRNTVPQTEG